MVLKEKVFVEEKSSGLPEEKERGESQELEGKKPFMESFLYKLQMCLERSPGWRWLRGSGEQKALSSLHKSKL